MLLRGTDTTLRQQEVEILEGPSTLHNTRGHQPDAMEIVRGLLARIEVKKEVMEEDQHEHARRHAQLQSVVEAKMKEAAELRGRLDDIALAFECTLCLEKLGAGSVSFSCGHTYCNRLTCGSRLVDTCPECRLPVASRVQLFGALPDVGGLLEQEPAAPDVEQVQRLASENAKASLEEIRKRSEAEKAVWQREKKEMQRQVNRLQEEVLAAANARASLEENRKRSEEDKAVWQREREEMQQQVNRLREATASLEEIRVQQNDQINKLRNAEKMSAKQMAQELDAERIGKEDVLQQHVAQQTKKRVSGGSKEQTAEPSAAAPPNKKQKQNMPGKACDADYNIIYIHIYIYMYIYTCTHTHTHTHTHTYTYIHIPKLIYQ
jgi:hypothetical protein